MYTKSFHLARPRTLFFLKNRGARAHTIEISRGSVRALNILLIGTLIFLTIFHVYIAVILSSAPLRLNKLQGEEDVLLDEVKRLEGSIREFETPQALEAKARALGMVSVPHYEFISSDREEYAKK